MQVNRIINVWNCLQDLICSQESEPGTSKSTRHIASEVGISEASVKSIAKSDLSLSSFKRVPAQVISEATKLKRMTRCKLLSRRITVEKAIQVFFKDEKLFYTDPPVNKQNRVWAVGRKREVNPQRLLVQRAKFSPSVMVSAGVCYGGKRTKQKSTQSITWPICYQSWSRTARM